MKLIPAIDLMKGKCVRLLKGNFNKSKEIEKRKVDTDFGEFELHIWEDILDQNYHFSLSKGLNVFCYDCKMSAKGIIINKKLIFQKNE